MKNPSLFICKKTLVIILFILAIVIPKANMAQDSLLNSKLTDRNPFEHTFIKFSPLSLIDIEPSFKVGIEYNVSPKIRLQHEIAYVALFNPLYYLDRYFSPQDISSSGYKAHTCIKFPNIFDNVSDKNKHNYIGIDLMFKRLYITEYDVNVWRMNGAYRQIMDIKTVKSVATIHLIYGVNNYRSVKNKIITDWYFGLGLRYKEIYDNAPAESNYYRDLPFYDDFEGFLISVTAGFKFGFEIK